MSTKKPTKTIDFYEKGYSLHEIANAIATHSRETLEFLEEPVLLNRIGSILEILTKKTIRAERCETIVLS